MSYISDNGKNAIPLIISCGVLNRIVQLLEHPTLAIAVSCLRTIGNVLTGDDSQTQAAINEGALQSLDRLITHPKKAVRKEVCWSVSNITAGTALQIQQAIDVGILDKLIMIIINDDFEIKREAVWALSNTTQNASPQQYLYMVERNALTALTTVLAQPDAKTLIVALEGLENFLKAGKINFLDERGENRFALMLEMCGGVDRIEEL